jgi:hypothetical protein
VYSPVVKRLAGLALFSLLLTPAFGQWTDIKKLGEGGESYVSTDGKGNVYATSHFPCKLYVSNDSGKSYGISHDLPNSFCDVTSTVGPDGKLYVSYIVPGVKGLQVTTSIDQGKTIQKGGLHPGDFDREWIVVHPTTGEVGMNYSDGYIGGPKSKGVFYAGSTDGGASFKQISRIDNEPSGSYPVDPYLTIGAGGRIYAAWAASTDYDHIDKYAFAASEDGGKTWINHTEIAKTHKLLGDTQERWMLGSIVAVGNDTVMAVYQDYATFNVDGEEVHPLLAYYRVSNDGGKTWSASKPCLQPKEITDAIRLFLKTRVKSSTVANYMQTLPWVSSDGKGRVHFVFEDNRTGQRKVGNKPVGLWHVRYATWDGTKFGTSERVSHDWAAERPPLDFIGCCSDSKNVWVIWTENPEKAAGWDFSGELFIGRKPLR